MLLYRIRLIYALFWLGSINNILILSITGRSIFKYITIKLSFTLNKKAL